MTVATVKADQPTSAAGGAADWVAHFEEGWRAPRDPDSFAAHFEKVLVPEIRLIQPQMPDLVGYRAFREAFVRPLFGLIPDLRGEVERWAAQGDSIFIQLRLRGTLGRRPIAWTVVDVVTLRDGLATERRSFLDPAPLMRAILTRPRSWPRFVRFQSTMLRQRLRRGGP